MTTNDSTVSTLLVAIDISKHRHEVLVAVPGEKRRRRLTIQNGVLVTAVQKVPLSKLLKHSDKSRDKIVTD